jgi:hypothetical protein
MKKVLIGLVIAGVVALGIGAVGVAYAQEAIPAFFHGGPGGPGGRGPGDGTGPLHDIMVSEMAAALGINVDDLEARLEDGERFYDIAAEAGYEGEDFFALMDQVHAAVVEEALAQGLITEEQAGMMSQGPGRGGFGPGGMGGTGDGVLHDYITSALADALGISADDFIARRTAGETLVEIAASLGIDTSSLPDLLQSAHQAALDKALADGVITQDQYDQFQQGRQGGPGGMGGRPGGMGGYQGGPGFSGGNSDN